MRGVAFHNSRNRLALGHVNDMRCLEKVYAPANYRRRPELEIPQIYLSRCQSSESSSEDDMMTEHSM